MSIYILIIDVATDKTSAQSDITEGEGYAAAEEEEVLFIYVTAVWYKLQG